MPVSTDALTDALTDAPTDEGRALEANSPEPRRSVRALIPVIGLVLLAGVLLGAWASSAGSSLEAAFEPEPDRADATAGGSEPPEAGDPAPGAEEPEPSPEPEAPPSEPSPSPSPEPTPEGPPVTIAFGGDVMFEGMIRLQLDADPDGLLDPIAGVLGDADLAVVNLETAITDGGDPEPKEFTFRAPPTGLAALSSAGVDVASLANNHGMDYGLTGLEDTLDAAEETGLPLIGAGRDADEAYAPFAATVRGREVAVIGATQVMDSAFLGTWPATDDRPGLASAKDEHEDRLVRAVTEARETADTVVVYLHWGIEGERCPAERQQVLARRLVDAGADVIVGGHAHRLQGAGMLDDALVGYGLGNFVFYSRGGPGAESGVLTVTVEGSEILDYEWNPARIRDGIPHPLEGDEATQAVAAWDDLRDCTDLAP